MPWGESRRSGGSGWGSPTTLEHRGLVAKATRMVMAHVLCPNRLAVERLPPEAVIRTRLSRGVPFMHLREIRGVRVLAELPGDAL